VPAALATLSPAPVIAAVEAAIATLGSADELAAALECARTPFAAYLGGLESELTRRQGR
jgi:hypothetical protein